MINLILCHLLFIKNFFLTNKVLIYRITRNSKKVWIRTKCRFPNRILKLPYFCLSSFKRNFQEKFQFFSLESFLSFSPIVCIFFQARGFTGSNSQKAFKWQTLFKRRFMASQQQQQQQQTKKMWKIPFGTVCIFQFLVRLDNNWVFSTAAADSFLRLEKKNICLRAKMSQFLRYCRFSYFVGWQ